MIWRFLRWLEPPQELLSKARISALAMSSCDQRVLVFRISNLARRWEK